MSEIAVSIVIPCYNGERTLAPAIESALVQAGEGVTVDVVVIDDGSSDGSLALARAFEPAIRVLTGPNRGVSAARNTGIAETVGEWIVFLDADDLIAAGSLGRRLQLPGLADCDVVVCDWQELVDDGGEGQLGQTKAVDMAALDRDAELACAISAWAPTSALMYRRALVERIGGFRDDLPVIQDARFMFDAARCGARFLHAAHVGAVYRVLPQSLSRRSPARFWLDVLTNGKQIEALWRGDGPLSDARIEALAGIYDNAARSLFDAEDPAYFEAVRCLSRLPTRLSLHARLAHPLSRVIGLPAARRLAGLIRR